MEKTTHVYSRIPLVEEDIAGICEKLLKWITDTPPTEQNPTSYEGKKYTKEAFSWVEITKQRVDDYLSTYYTSEPTTKTLKTYKRIAFVESKPVYALDNQANVLKKILSTFGQRTGGTRTELQRRIMEIKG